MQYPSNAVSDGVQSCNYCVTDNISLFATVKFSVVDEGCEWVVLLLQLLSRFIPPLKYISCSQSHHVLLSPKCVYMTI